METPDIGTIRERHDRTCSKDPRDPLVTRAACLTSVYDREIAPTVACFCGNILPVPYHIASWPVWSSSSHEVLTPFSKYTLVSIVTFTSTDTALAFWDYYHKYETKQRAYIYFSSQPWRFGSRDTRLHGYGACGQPTHHGGSPWQRLLTSDRPGRGIDRKNPGPSDLRLPTGPTPERSFYFQVASSDKQIVNM